jgi:hypothetical protein
MGGSICSQSLKLVESCQPLDFGSAISPLYVSFIVGNCVVSDVSGRMRFSRCLWLSGYNFPSHGIIKSLRLADCFP